MDKDTFLSLIKTSEGCSFWEGAVSTGGYGVLSFNGCYYLAHKLSYILTKGDVEEGKFVCHKCDNKTCINPNHLYLGSPKDNSIDIVKRGKIGTSKLKHDDVVNILIENKSGVNGVELSRRYNISSSSVYMILKGLHYPHIFSEVFNEQSNSK